MSWARRCTAGILMAALVGCGNTTDAASADSSDPATSTASGPTCDADTTGTIEYARGSLPPPYHYSWVLQFRADSGSMTLQGGYADDADARWSADFTLTATASAELCRLVVDAAGGSDAGAEEPPPGSSSTQVTLTDGAGRRLDQELRDVPELAGEVIGVLPDGVWTGLDAKFQAWSDRQQR